MEFALKAPAKTKPKNASGKGSQTGGNTVDKILLTVDARCWDCGSSLNSSLYFGVHLKFSIKKKNTF